MIGSKAPLWNAAPPIPKIRVSGRGAVLRSEVREFTINGLRNRHLRALLFPTPAASENEARRRSGAVSRKLRILRAHGIIPKLPHTHRYQVTDHGRLVLNAVLPRNGPRPSRTRRWRHEIFAPRKDFRA